MKSEIEIFRVGTHTDMNGKTITVSRDDLVNMASSYDPSFHEAPIVLGHPVHNDPAYGWIKGLRVSDNDTLEAELHEVSPDFSEAVDKGQFKKVSASFYLPGASNNPAGDNYGLRHVGFLGAQVPAIKGLKSVSFADDENEAMTFTVDFGEQGWLFSSIANAFRSIREYLIDTNGLDAADKALPSYVVENLSDSANNLINSDRVIPAAFSEKPQPKTPTEEPEMDDDKKAAEELAARESDLKAREDTFLKEQADFAEAQNKRQEGENSAFIDDVIKQGKLSSGMKEPVLAFMSQINGSDTVSFGEQGDKTPLDFFKKMVSDAKPIVDFGEHTGDDNQNGPDGDDHQAIATAALIYQEEQDQKGNTIDIATAVRYVKKEA